jgi:hypothetical protein
MFCKDKVVIKLSGIIMLYNAGNSSPMVKMQQGHYVFERYSKFSEVPFGCDH